MADILEVSVVSTNQRMGFTGVAGENAPIAIDYTPPLGDDRGYTPLELQLISVAACSASAVALLARRMKREVSRITVAARGERRTEHPLCFARIELEFVVESPDASDAEVEKAIRMSEETYCPVWAMLKGNVQIAATHRIVRGG